MSGRVDIREIRAGCEQFGEDEARFWCPDILALVEAVDAAHRVCSDLAAPADDLAFDGELELRAALARFDFGDGA